MRNTLQKRCTPYTRYAQQHCKYYMHGIRYIDNRLETLDTLDLLETPYTGHTICTIRSVCTRCVRYTYTLCIGLTYYAQGVVYTLYAMYSAHTTCTISTAQNVSFEHMRYVFDMRITHCMRMHTRQYIQSILCICIEIHKYVYVSCVHVRHRPQRTYTMRDACFTHMVRRIIALRFTTLHCAALPCTTSRAHTFARTRSSRRLLCAASRRPTRRGRPWHYSALQCVA